MRKETDRELEIFMKNVSLLRKNNGLTKKEMAKIIGISTATLNKIEGGDFPPRLSANVLIRIYHKFGIFPSKLLSKIIE